MNAFVILVITYFAIIAYFWQRGRLCYNDSILNAKQQVYGQSLAFWKIM